MYFPTPIAGVNEMKEYLVFGLKVAVALAIINRVSFVKALTSESNATIL
jgi:hypothetical protein